MRRPLLVAAALLSLTLLLPTGFAEPRDGWSLSARLPASTLAYVSLEDIHRWGERLEATAIGRLVNDPSMAEFAAPLRKAVKDLGASESVPPEVRDVLAQLQRLRGELAVALVGMDKESGPRLVASLDFGPHVSDFAAFLESFASRMGDDMQLSAREEAGRRWWTLALRGGPRLEATAVDTVFVAATDRDLLAQVVAAPSAAGTLGLAPEFAGSRARLGVEGLSVFAYGNVPAALAQLAGEWQGEERRIADALGLDTVKSVCYGLAFAGDGFRDSLLVNTAGADHGIPTLFALPPLERSRFLDLVPGNAFVYEEANVSLGSLLTAVRSVARVVDEDAPRELDEGLAELDRALGVSLEKDILGGLAGAMGWYAGLSSGGGLYPEIALMATVKDPAAYEQVLVRVGEGLAGLANEEGRVIVRPRAVAFEGQTLHVMELSAAQGDDVVPFTPSWTLLGDRLIVTLVPYTLKDIVWRAKHPESAGPGLGAQEDFGALGALRPATAGALAYLDLQAVLTLLYDTGVPLLQTAVKPNLLGELGATLPLDWTALPPVRAIRGHLRSLMSFTSLSRDGLELRLHGPLPLLPVMVAAGGAVGAMMARPPRHRDGMRMPPFEMPPGEDDDGDLPLLQEARTNEARAVLDMLLRAVRLHVLEHETLPASLEELVLQGTLENLPLDPWGRPYRLVVVDGAARAFRVASDGPDRRPGTDDDLQTDAR